MLLLVFSCIWRLFSFIFTETSFWNLIIKRIVVWRCFQINSGCEFVIWMTWPLNVCEEAELDLAFYLLIIKALHTSMLCLASLIDRPRNLFACRWAVQRLFSSSGMFVTPNVIDKRSITNKQFCCRVKALGERDWRGGDNSNNWERVCVWKTESKREFNEPMITFSCLSHLPPNPLFIFAMDHPFVSPGR